MYIYIFTPTITYLYIHIYTQYILQIYISLESSPTKDQRVATLSGSRLISRFMLLPPAILSTIYASQSGSYGTQTWQC